MKSAMPVLRVPSPQMAPTAVRSASALQPIRAEVGAMIAELDRSVPSFTPAVPRVPVTPPVAAPRHIETPTRTVD